MLFQKLRHRPRFKKKKKGTANVLELVLRDQETFEKDIQLLNQFSLLSAQEVTPHILTFRINTEWAFQKDQGGKGGWRENYKTDNPLLEILVGFFLKKLKGV